MAAELRESQELSEEAERLVDRWKDGISQGVIPQGVYNNQEIFELEMEHIFDKSWQLIGFEGEIPDPGDYVQRPIGSDNYILTRDEDGRIRVLLNSCAHQGAPLCNASQGNTSHFRCRYHGWTFDNTGELIGVPMQSEAYGDSETVKSHETDLLEVPNDSYNGMIFACPDPDTDESLDDFLGDYKWTLDFFTAPEYEVRGPQRHVGNVNWKIGAFNGMADSYHIFTTHRSVMEVGVFDTSSATERSDEGSSDEDREKRYTVHTGPGAAHYSERGDLGLYPEAIQEVYREALSEEQWELGKTQGLTPITGGIFPHTTTTDLFFMVDEGQAVPVKQVHIWRPLGPNKSEQLYWNIVEKDAPEELKEKSLQAQSFMAGTAGMQLVDDQETQSKISTVSRGRNARKKNFRIDMKMNIEEKKVEDTLIPGDVYDVALNEENYRYIHGKVVEEITGERVY